MSKTLGIILAAVGAVLIIIGVLNHYKLYVGIWHLALFASAVGIILIGVGIAVYLLALQPPETGTPVRMGAQPEAQSVAATAPVSADDPTLPTA